MGRKGRGKGTPDDPAPVPAVPAAAEASAATAAEPDATLGSLLSTERRRPRWDDEPPLLCTGIVAGYLPGLPGEEDLEQAQPQLCPDKQSQEIWDTPELLNSPISKYQRRRYNWAAASVKGPGHYTMNPEKMQLCEKYSDSRCDICGKGEKLYLFRAWERSSQEAPHLRRLHPVIAYFGQDCGKGLLGKRTSSVIDLERAKELLECSEESLRKQISSLNARDRMALHRALVRISGQEEGIRNPELAQAEQSFGRLHRAEDPFRALHRFLCYAISHRDLAVLVASHMKRQHRWPEMGGLLMKALQCLELQEPLPSVQRMSREELYECLTWVTAALPCLEVELYDNGFPGEPRIFKAPSQPVQEEPSSKKSRSKKKAKKATPAPEVYSVTLIYLSVVGELHVERSPRKPLDQRQQAAIRQAAKPLLEAALPGWSSGAVRGTSASCSGPRKVEDGWVIVPDDRQVSFEDVLSALQQITWPDCTSRRNVLQEGQVSVQAFCLGLAKAYFTQEMRLSRGTQVLPSLTKLLALFAKTIPGDPHFQYSTIQLNRNYNARLHVDKNNNGPSWIIALGEYTGGALWIYDPHVPEKECVKVKVEMPLRGYPHLKVCQMLPGRAHCIKNRWLRFDGRCPHAALPFEGTRMSLVYFSRRGSSTILPEARQVLEGLHMPLPTEAWLAATSDALPHSSETPITSAIEDADSSDDDEPDDYSAEANGAGLSLPRDFSEVFLHALEAAPATDQAVIGVASLGAGIAAPMSLHPLGFKTEVAIAAEDTAIRLAKGFKVAKATKDVDSFIKGKGLCEVRHKQEDLKPPHEHIFHAVVDGAPLSLYCYNEERGFSTSKETAAFRKIEAFLAERRPCLALIEVPDFDHVLSTLNRRAIDTCNFIRRRLGAIKGYSVEVAQVFARDFGLPLAGSLLHVFAARKDVVPPARLAEVADLARALGARLPASRTQDFLVPDEDRDLQELQRKLWARGGSAAPVASPYMDFLLKSELSKSWFFSATGDEQKLLTQAYKLALENRMDVASLLVDLCAMKKLNKESDISDNGHLPNSSSKAWHYAFARHRPLIGKEQLLCRGYRLQDLSPASLRSCSDQELRNFCRKAPLIPATAASLLAMLAVADMGAGTGRLLRVSEANLLQLIEEGRKLPPTQVHLMRNEVADPDQVAKDMRAAMCMALLGKAMPADAMESPVKKGKDKKGKGADATDEDGPVVGSDDQQHQSLLGKLSMAEDVTGSWEDRGRKAAFWAEQLEALPFDRVMRWIAEAHQEPENEHSPRILKEGLRYLQLCLTFAIGNAEAVRPLLQTSERQRERLLDKKLTRLSETFEDFLATLEQIRETNDGAGDVSRLCVHWAIDRGRQKDARFILGGARPVSFFVQIMRVVAREGSAKPAAVSYVIEQVKNRWKGLTPEAKNDFHAADGMRVLISLLKQVNFKAQDWPNAEASLTFLLQEFKEVPGFPRALLVLLQKEGWRFSEVQQLPHSFLFEVVLDPLMDHIRKSNVKENGERKAIAAIHDFVDSTDPTPLEERLLATARALEQLEKTRRDLRDVQVKPTVDFLSELKETTVGEAKRILDAEQAKIDAIFRAQAPGKWQDLRKTESRLIKEATEMIEEKEKSLKRSAAEAEARKQKRQRNQQLDEAKKLSDKLAKMVKKSTPEKGSTQTWSLLSSSEAAADAVRAWCKAFDDKKAECDKCDAFERPDEATLEPWLREAKEAINDFQAKKLSEQLAKLLKKSNCEKGSKATWSLVRFTEDAAEELKEWCQAFNDKKAAPECSKYAPFERPHEASLEPWLKEAQGAFKDFQEHEGRLVELRRQLGLLNIPDGVIAVLKQGQRLHRLRELAQRPQLLDGIGLPPGIADRLLEGQANLVNLDLKLPSGWFSKRSTRYMVEYYYLNQRTEWFWPEQDADPPARGWPASVAGLQPAPPGSCVYIQDWSDSTKWCFLCNDEATLDHLEDRRHAASRSAWQRLSEKLDHLSEEASKVSAPRNGEELKEDLILQCWMEHTLNSLEEEGVDPRIVQLFVVQCVRPHFPKSLNGGALAAALSSCFSEAAASSRQPEPDVLIHPPVPVPGTDFPMVPGGMLVEIENPEEAQWIQAAKNLTEMDLLRHGLILQESGQLHCVFCETPGRPEVVENEPWAIARHLSKSRSQPGRTHQKYRQHWEGFARWLKQDGWKCKERGVSLVGRNWSCGCGKQGDVDSEWLPGHFEENKHKEWEKTAKKDPKATCMRPSAAINQQLMETWTKAFEAAARKHVNRLLLNATPVGAAKKRRDPETPKGETPAARAQGPDAHRAAGPKRPKPAASPQTPPIGEERPPADGGGGIREPPLPELGKNFPDLSRGEFQHQGDKVFCRICEQTMRKDELETHRASKNHVKWAQSSRWAFNLLRRVGCDLWKTGKHFGEGDKAKSLICGCGKEIQWYEICSWFPDEGQTHDVTKAHLKYWHKPEPSPQAWEEARLQRWRGMFRPPEPGQQQEPASTQRRAAEDPAPSERPQKKLRQNSSAEDWVVVGRNQEADVEEEEAPSCSSSRAAYSMERAKAMPAPTAEDLGAKGLGWGPFLATRGFPELQAPLVWGWFNHKAKHHKEAWTWCTSCGVWVASVTWSTEQDTHTLSEEGACPHWARQRHRCL